MWLATGADARIILRRCAGVGVGAGAGICAGDNNYNNDDNSITTTNHTSTK